MNEILAILPATLRTILTALPIAVRENLEEIRLRQNQPLEVRFGQQSSYVTPSGQITSIPAQGWLFSAEEAAKLLNQVSQHSLYALEEELKRGYITVVGGHRIGIAGKVVLDKGEVKGIRDVTSFNIRIAREKKGAAKKVMPYLFEDGKLLNTLLISPPQCGKTTLLRDMARTISYGSEWSSSRKVGIVDERSELAGCLQGVPQRDVGPRTDVLDACPKAAGMMMMIRSMSPDVLIVDEVGRAEDGDAVWEAIHAGVAVICSAHGASVKEVAERPMLGKLIRYGAFSRYIVLSRAKGVGTIQAIYDQSMNLVEREKVSWSS
ncbi:MULTISPECIES: stage III sporulation protein AA [Brevibacillus]|uniref:Stage III sporulation protein AA n=1 Tax=Brevibacillus porteri TaxID=2126350 RepID=A0ABX5FPD2_9BACL|nr:MULTISPECIES: stage III sporulation protein AA [Brevibacillus]MDC0759996.1 stage III sporulation protein AA [Brevibacillus sp. AG]MED1801679.1 stage III sporulation protein AA [Brevibacillus porteri]MED2133406.1 stage III sporulation protein AA [Brevibacillus porteri]MED2745841.1 stage III sporulation protein AA [Brevibacillus porteri]MED2818187.1 stage III sporulation protein AA [Brevibacillus porteri]